MTESEERVVPAAWKSSSKTVITKIAEKLRGLIEKEKFSELNNVTASFGITTYEENDNVSTLIQKADYSLYKAKQTGKNRVCFIEDSDEY